MKNFYQYLIGLKKLKYNVHLNLNFYGGLVEIKYIVEYLILILDMGQSKMWRYDIFENELITTLHPF